MLDRLDLQAVKHFFKKSSSPGLLLKPLKRIMCSKQPFAHQHSPSTSFVGYIPQRDLGRKAPQPAEFSLMSVKINSGKCNATFKGQLYYRAKVQGRVVSSTSLPRAGSPFGHSWVPTCSSSHSGGKDGRHQRK